MLSEENRKQKSKTLMSAATQIKLLIQRRPKVPMKVSLKIKLLINYFEQLSSIHYFPNLKYIESVPCFYVCIM